MKARTGLVVVALILVSCSADSTTSTSASTVPTTDGSTTTSTTVLGTTTTTTEFGFPVIELPLTEVCTFTPVADGGEATVVVAGRLYGLGADGLSPHCLLENVDSVDIAWGPKGDRVRVGSHVTGPSSGPEDDFKVLDALGFDWTEPTGSSLLAFSTNRLWKTGVDDGVLTDITFLEETDAVAYHPAGEHLLAVGTDSNAQYGLWLATNQGTDPLRLAFDEGAVLYDPAWTWLGEPIFAAAHIGGDWHIHRVDITSEGGLDGPIIVESDEPVDMLIPSPFDPIMLAYRTSGERGVGCVEGSRVAVSNVDVPEPLDSLTTTPVGWLSGERLLVIAYPDGCGSAGDLWSFSPGLCPGSVYGAFPVIAEIDGAAAREALPTPPPPPDFTGVIDPAPA